MSVLLPNGPELAVLIIACNVMHAQLHSIPSKYINLRTPCLVIARGYCVAPINPTATEDEIAAELQSTRSRALCLLQGASINANHAALQVAERLGVGVLVITALGNASLRETALCSWLYLSWQSP